MEEYNIRNLRYTLGAALLEEDARKAEPKIGRLLDRDVADPWYTGDFEATYCDVVEGAMRLLGD
jgi:protein-tyrosine phosphatase